MNRYFTKLSMLMILLCMVMLSFGCTSQEEYLSQAIASLDEENYEQVTSIAQSFKEEAADGFKAEIFLRVEQFDKNKEFDKALSLMNSLKDAVNLDDKIAELELHKDAYNKYIEANEVYKTIKKAGSNEEKYRVIDKAIDMYKLVQKDTEEAMKAQDKIADLTELKTKLNYEDAVMAAKDLFEAKEYKRAIAGIEKALAILSDSEAESLLEEYKGAYQDYRDKLEKELLKGLVADPWTTSAGETIEKFKAKGSIDWFTKPNFMVYIQKSKTGTQVYLKAGYELSLGFKQIDISYDDKEMTIPTQVMSDTSNYKGTTMYYESEINSSQISKLKEVSESANVTISFVGEKTKKVKLSKDMIKGLQTVIKYYEFLIEE